MGIPLPGAASVSAGQRPSKADPAQQGDPCENKFA